MRFFRLLIVAVLGLPFAANSVVACPFCTALKPTLAQQSEQSAVVALAEVEEQPAAGKTRLRLHKVIAGADRLEDRERLDAALDLAAKPGTLVLLFGTAEDSQSRSLDWHAVAVNETSYGYFARRPAAKKPVTERLRYYAPFLEHSDPLIAEDSYLEFGHAQFDQVAEVADALSMSLLRAWLLDPKVPPERKGFYGLALGLARDPDERMNNARFLRQQIFTPDIDFRAGFDGLLGGYMLLTGPRGLVLLEDLYLNNPQSADGDTRHALTAVRFYHEYGREIPVERLEQALRLLLTRAEFSEAVITDLARWKDWSAVDQIAAMYDDPKYAQPAVRRAIVGYLLACPAGTAATALAQLRKTDPQGVAAAEAILARTSGLSTGQ